ncbi:MAG: hypothetical protein FK734_08155 [Asgard group archaeon]|nr:hypothetical protein [Asgard group archaeon]
MKLARIIKNKKALTPLMIGIIVTASVVAVLFIVLAATMPFYVQRDVEMHLRENYIIVNQTDSVSLTFKVISDYQGGVIEKFEIYKNGIEPTDLYGTFVNSTELFKNEERLFTVIFDATANAGGLDKDESNHLVFIKGNVYTLKITYSDIDYTFTKYLEHSFTYI